jgi:TolB-like protein/Tfp pilus assembly protein PilF
LTLSTHPVHPEVLRFGDFELNLISCELRKGGKVLHLQPQPAKVLSLLAIQAGKLVTREELKNQIWQDTTFVNFEDGLNFCIRSIRAVLHDSADAPRFIQTLPRRGYRFLAPVAQGMAEDSEKLDSLAVLPLKSLSDDPDQDYFADGMTDELITELAKIRGLRVISRTSAEQYKESRKSLPEIARRLNVSAVVEGTVLRFGNRARITIQLIRARNEQHLWAQSFERELGDILRLQSELAITIAGQIHLRLSAQDQRRLSSSRRIDPSAHEAYLRGRYFCNKRTEDTLKKALNYFEQSIDIEPTYAPAYSGLADTYFYRGYYFGKMAPAEAMPKARAAALKALELDNTLAEAHTSLALVKFFFEWDFAAAAQELNNAIALNPNYATAYQAYSVLLGAMKRHGESVAEARKALEVDPLSIPVNNIVGEMLAASRHWIEAIEQYRKTIELDPNVPLVHENLGIALEEVGRNDQAIDEYLIARTLSGEDPAVAPLLRSEYEKHGLTGFRQKQLQFALERWDGWHVDAFQIASLYARLGNPEAAMEWLEKAFDARSGMLIWLIMYADFKNIFSNPEFELLVQRVGLLE